ncbi:MAG: hypothetical protein ABSA82_05060 [Thermacetogeniaceae bacterium]
MLRPTQRVPGAPRPQAAVPGPPRPEGTRLATLAIKVAVRRLHVSSANASANANKNLTSHIPNQQAGW